MDNYEKKIREFLDSSEVDQLYKSMLLNLFPEFRENEDEITRKELLEYIKNHPEAPEGHIRKGVLLRWVAWLEKQGEQKPDTDFSDLRTWKYIVDAVLTEKEGIGQYLDSPFTEEVAKKLQKRFGNIEQKPTEWSEEDEKKKWKPSEEQMDALLHMKSVLVPQNLGPNVTILLVDSLYYDLKKLMD